MGVTQLPERAVRWFDDRQQDAWPLAFPVGVIRKYADDRGSALAGVVSFHVFVGMLPVLVVFLTVLGIVLEGSADLREAAVESVLSELPVVGSRLREDVGALTASGWVLAVAVVGLLWSATGIYTSLQFALNQVWQVEGVHRQGFVSRQVRALLLFALVLIAAVGTAFLRMLPVLQPSARFLSDLLSMAAAVAIATVVLLAVHRLVVSPAVPLRRLLPAAFLAALLWELLQLLGTWIVLRRLGEADDLYGALGFVVVMLGWINLLARSIIFANAWATVSWRHLWPRRIAQPPLTEADERVLEGLAGNERRRPEQRTTVEFEEPDGSDRS